MLSFNTAKHIRPRHLRKIFLLVAVASSLILQGCSVVGVRTTEEAVYTLVKQENDFEIRQYASVMAVQTYVDQEDFDDASGIAFRRLFDYITGNNLSTDDIAMTAPVIASPAAANKSQKIAMTSPVIATPKKTNETGWTLSFVLPASFTAANSPSPTDPSVKLTELPEKTVAAIRYTGLWDNERFETQTEMLHNWLKDNGYQSISGPSYAGYDPPWALPFLRRNEVLIDVQP